MRHTLLPVLGGSWHDFSGFGGWLAANASELGVRCDTVSQLESLTSRDAETVDVVLLYNCFDAESELRYSEAQVENLVQWVESGGSVMALHSATVAARSEPRLRALLGGAFVDHPPYREIQVRPTGAAHSTTRGIAPFVVSDELYRHELDPRIDVHLLASAGGDEHPVAWTRCVQAGRVSYLGLGHDVGSWRHPAFSRLLRQSIAWLCVRR